LVKESQQISGFYVQIFQKINKDLGFVTVSWLLKADYAMKASNEVANRLRRENFILNLIQKRFHHLFTSTRHIVALWENDESINKSKM